MSEGFSKLHALSAVRDDRTLPKSERLVLLMLISHAKHGTGECFPSLDLLADECDMARSAVAAAVSSLRARGAASPVRVTVVRRCRVTGRGRESNVYRLDLSPAGGLKSGLPKSSRRTQVPNDLSPKIGRPESKKGPDLSPAGGLEAGKEAGQEAGKRSAATSAAGSFALESPSSTAPAPAKRASRKTRGDSKLHPRVGEMKAHYVARYEIRKGAAPDFGKSWSRAMVALSALCSVRDGFDAGMQVVTNALANEFNHRILPWEIASEVPKHQGNQPRPAFGRRGTDVQRGDVRPEVEAAARAAGEALAGDG